MELFFGLLTACQPLADIAHDPSAAPLDVVREAARQALERTEQSAAPAAAQPPPPPPLPPPPPQAEAAAQGAAASSGS